MPWTNFTEWPLWLNGVVFAAASAVIWLAGSRLSVYADVIAHRTGLGEAFVGLVFLAIATSLPEIGRTIGAASLANAPLAITSLFGGIGLQTAVLAVADFAVARRALTFFAPRPVLLLQGAVVVLLVGIALAGIAAGNIVQLFGVGLWPMIIFAAYLYSLYALKRYEGRAQWQPVDLPDELVAAELARAERRGARNLHPLRRVAMLFGLSSAVIFVAGLVVAETGNAMAIQTGIGSGFVGGTLLAFASALPEISTTIAAVRFGAYSMAVANIFGTNAFLAALVLLADIFYRPGPILEAADQSAAFAASVGLVTTTVYLMGMIERRNRVVLGMGVDSLAVIIIYVLSLPVLYIIP